MSAHLDRGRTIAARLPTKSRFHIEWPWPPCSPPAGGPARASPLCAGNVVPSAPYADGPRKSAVVRTPRFSTSPPLASQPSISDQVSICIDALPGKRYQSTGIARWVESTAFSAAPTSPASPAADNDGCHQRCRTAAGATIRDGHPAQDAPRCGYWRNDDRARPGRYGVPRVLALRHGVAPRRSRSRWSAA